MLPLLLCVLLVARDWQQHPAVVQLDTTAEVYAMGDVHGDLERLQKVLAAAGIIHGKDGWSAGNAVVVFTGDLIDKGPNALGVIALLRKLQTGAANAGGRVIVLMGNHEAEFLANPDTDKTKDFAGELEKADLNRKDVAACGGDVGGFLCSLPVAARVNDWFFSHAGNTDGRTIEHLESDLRAGIEANGFAAKQLSDPNSIVEARIGDRGPNGRSWFEAGRPKIAAEELLKCYAGALGVHHIVEGHHRAEVRFSDGALRKAGEMYQWRGELFLIDTGMSRDTDDSAGAILHIHPGPVSQAFAICPDSRITTIWRASKPDKTGHAKACAPKN